MFAECSETAARFVKRRRNHMSTFDVKAQKKVFKAASLMGPRSGLPTSIESDETGRITRVRPIWYEDYIDWDSRNPWKIEARGKTCSAPRHSLPRPWRIGR